MIDPWDIREDTARYGDTVRISLLHLPTGIKVTRSGTARKWETIRAAAMTRLEVKVGRALDETLQEVPD